MTDPPLWTVKCTVVGNATVGKTSMLMYYLCGSLPEYPHSLIESISRQLRVGNQTMNLELWDIAGQVSQSSPRLSVNTQWFLGTKFDLRDDTKSKEDGPITQRQGEDCAAKIKAVKYLECSALTQDGLGEVFEEAARAAIYRPKSLKKKKKCAIM